MTNDMPSLRDVLCAAERIRPYLAPTPLVAPAALARRLGVDVALKLECLQPVGAFKVRGGVNLVAAERQALEGRRLFAASTGNHGQSVAYAARLFGLEASIYAPEGANPLKVDAMRALGAEVVLTGADFDAAREACEADAARRGGRYIHSMNEPLLVAGVATLYLESLQAMPDADTVIVPVGGGSGVSAAGLVAKSVDPAIRVVGVQAAGAPAFYRSFLSGTPEATERADTRAEGLATRKAFELPLTMARRYVDEIVLVTDADMEDAMRLLLETAHVVPEMAGAASVAAVMTQRERFAGHRIIAPVTGGNATLAQIAALFGQLPD